MNFGKQVRRKAGQLGKMVAKIDMFQEPTPGFNIDGSRGESTILGTLFSFMIIITLILYGQLKS